MLGVLGAVLGAFFSFAIVKILQFLQITYSFGKQSDLILNPVLSFSEILSIGLIVIIISLIASISPAIKASKLDPVEALRTN